MKIYVAGPMTGLPEFNYPAFFAAGEKLREMGFEPVLPTATTDHIAPTEAKAKPWNFYVREALKILLECDGIYRLDGWENSKGAVLEYEVAKALGMEVVK